MEKFLSLAAGMLLAFSGSLYAESLSGTVVTKSENSFQVRPDDRQKFEGKTVLDVKVRENTDFQGIHSLDEIRTGDQVKLEVKEAGDSGYQAQSVSLSEDAQKTIRASAPIQGHRDGRAGPIRAAVPAAGERNFDS